MSVQNYLHIHICIIRLYQTARWAILCGQHSDKKGKLSAVSTTDKAIEFVLYPFVRTAIIKKWLNSPLTHMMFLYWTQIWQKRHAVILRIYANVLPIGNYLAVVKDSGMYIRKSSLIVSSPLQCTHFSLELLNSEIISISVNNSVLL